MSGADAMREILKIDPEARGMLPEPYRRGDLARTIREVMNGP